MGTACELLRLRDDGLVDRIKVSLDGFPKGAGVMLFRHYRTDDAVDRLFAHGDHAVSLAPDPLEMDWEETDERSPVTLAELLRRGAGPDDPAILQGGAARAEGEDGRGASSASPRLTELERLGLLTDTYTYAHGRWAHASSVDGLIGFLDTGESTGVLTRGYLLANGAKATELDATRDAAPDERRGMLAVEPTEVDGDVLLDVFLIDERGRKSKLNSELGIVDDGYLQSWDGRRVVVRSATTVAVTPATVRGWTISTTSASFIEPVD